MEATVLHRVATMHASAERVVRFLIARGADPSIRGQEHGATPAQWALYHGQDTLAALLGSPDGSDQAGSQNYG